MTLVIETHGLRKEFGSGRGRIVAVDGLDLAVPSGGVHGFLGPNGSGKTTTIRMLLGLARASAGEMALFGERVPAALPRVIGRIGAVVEQPQFTPGFSGRRNLRLLARTAGVDPRRVPLVLEQVGLAGRERDRFRTYSLGMKQRLAIAATLLKEPDLLILDEPSNGLDPAGIRDMRELVTGLADAGVTVLLSSHILAEVQQVCHSVTIIGNGRTVASGSVESLLGESRSRTRVGVGDPARAAAMLERAGYGVERDGDDVLVEGHDHPEEISRLLAGERALRLRALRHPSRPGDRVPPAHARPSGGGCPMSRRSGAVTERPALPKLVGVELTRFRSRRAILLLVAAAIVLSGLFAAKLAWDTRPITPEDLATAKAQAAINAKDRQVQADLKACRERPEEYIGAGGTAEQCAETILPRPESYLARGPLDVDDVLPGHGIAVAILLVVLMMLAGTTFAGADWASGSMSNQLLFESQRSRIWTAKALALGIGVLVVTALGLAGVLGARAPGRAPTRHRGRRRPPGRRRLAPGPHARARGGRRGAGLRPDHAVPAHGGDRGAAVRRERRGGDPAQPAAVLGLRPDLPQPQRLCVVAGRDAVLRLDDHVLRRRRLRPGPHAGDVAGRPADRGRVRGRDGGLAGLVPAPRPALRLRSSA